MNVFSYVAGITLAAAVMVMILELLRRDRLSERHAIWWLTGGFLGLVVTIFPKLLIWLSLILGVTLPANLAFFISIVLLALLSLQHSAELTRLEEKTRRLNEELALLMFRVQTLDSTAATPSETPRAATQLPSSEATQVDE